MALCMAALDWTVEDYNFQTICLKEPKDLTPFEFVVRILVRPTICSALSPNDCCTCTLSGQIHSWISAVKPKIRLMY